MVSSVTHSFLDYRITPRTGPSLRWETWQGHLGEGCEYALGILFLIESKASRTPTAELR